MNSAAQGLVANVWQPVQPGLDLRISPDDDVYRSLAGSGVDETEALCAYLAHGHEIVDAVEQALAACDVHLREVHALLDCGCGHGCSTRFLVHRLARERLTVYDSDPGAVSFHAECLSVRGVTELAGLEGARFGAISAISLFSKLPEDVFVPLLGELVERLEPGGVLVLSTESPEGVEGFEYEAASPSSVHGSAGYGAARCSPEWFERSARSVRGVSFVRRAAGALGHEDIWVLGSGRDADASMLTIASPPEIEIDAVRIDRAGLAVDGWALDHDRNPISALHVLAGENTWAPERNERPDVAAHFGAPSASGAGFALRVNWSGGPGPRHVFVLARDADGRMSVRAKRATFERPARAPSESESRILERMQRGREVLAYGSLVSVYDGEVHDSGLYPHLAERAEGCRLWDVSGREYLDWFLGWGPMLLGHRHPEVEEAIERQLRSAPALSLMHDLEIQVAEQLTRMIPCAEKVAFGKNGSDVTLAAVRTARAATGRELVVTCGYHGFHDWNMVQYPWCEGVPAVLRDCLRTFPYNDLEALAELLDAEGGRVAAVILEPTANVLPADGFLEGVKRLTHSSGALLIFDEMVTGFRVARGGAQEAYGVVPDMGCFGKALANGMPLSALVGRAEVMSVLPRVGFGLTYRGELLSLAAARAALEVHAREPVAAHVQRTGESVRTQLDELARTHGVELGLQGFAGRMTFWTRPANGISADGVRILFQQQCLREGVLTNGNMMGSYAHDAASVERTLEALDRALAVTAQAISAGILEPFLDVPVRPEHYEA